MSNGHSEEMVTLAHILSLHNQFWPLQQRSSSSNCLVANVLIYESYLKLDNILKKKGSRVRPFVMFPPVTEVGWGGEGREIISAA